MRWKWCVALITLTLVAGACASDATDDETSGNRTPEAPTDAAAQPPAASAFALDEPWVEHEGGEECRCADGSPFTYASRNADPERVVLYFQGGGACFSSSTCSFENGTYTVQADVSGLVGSSGPGSGIFDFTNEANPLREWSFIFVPYCTGDVHLGDNVQDYGDGLEVNHNGYLNASKGFDHLIENFAGAKEVLVTGSSAGGVPAPLFGGLVADELPDADVTVLSDASGAYPDNPPVNAAIGALWGATNSIPDWPETEGLGPDEYSIPGLFNLAGRHDPDIRFARFDNAYDGVQAQFSALSGLSDGDQLAVLQATEAGIEADGVVVHSYIAAGDEHTILGRPDFYTLDTDGVSFLEWFTDYLGGADVDDVVCTDCEKRVPGEG